jgi:hypothetical protein
MRYFIFFYRCQDSQSTQYGQQGVAGKKFPTSKLISVAISDNNTYLPSQCTILGFNEVSEEDYNSFFDKKGNGE